MMRTHVLAMLAAVCVVCAPLAADEAAPLSALAKMPVKEVTVFKDGHALVLHQGKMPTDANGNVLMDYLPAPVFGTFWPYSAEKNAPLSAVVAGQRKVSIERTALALRELIEANIGAQVAVTEFPIGKEASGTVYPATIQGVPTQSGEELEATSPPNTGEKLPVKGNVVLLKTEAGLKVVSFDRIQDITFKGEHKAKNAQQEFRNLLTLKLEWADKKADKTAEVGLMYVQKGIRWIPEYKISLDGKGVATIKLQATLINELTDLEDVTANLVIGVPTFAFTLDGLSPRAACQELDAAGINAWDGNFYALEGSMRLGLEAGGGMIRVGAVHYNTREEIDRLVDALRRIGRGHPGAAAGT